ncbi:hypothetical protein BOX15_Mlig010599g1 [Macrostomum lignano]|uniref:EGF-like domain-containing protein n=1 Tax=Macrostomum lignano TaxID=282301 RepID=A0A267EQD3_9PLAT|nr:hypothetical protein BOX15_Mlig010599g1 [Macrostomum lignano]
MIPKKLVIILIVLITLPNLINSSSNDMIQTKSAAGNNRLQHWKADLIGELELMRIRDRNAGLIRPRGTNSYRMLGLRTFNLMTNPIVKSMESGFPGNAYASGALPVLFWWVRLQGTFCVEDRTKNPRQQKACRVLRDANNCNELFQIHTFNTMLHQMDWQKLMDNCNEIKQPRCSWHRFLGLLDPFAIDYYSQLDLGMVTRFDGFSRRYENPHTFGPIFYLPYKEKSCYPIRDIDTLSALYIYNFCMRYKKLLLNASTEAFRQQRYICPNPCLGNPCARKNFATGSCVVLGFLQTDYECKCRHNFQFDRNIGQCKPMDLCRGDMFCSKMGTSACKFNVTSGQVTCVCHSSFMGRRCRARNNACINRSHHPELVTGNEACRVTGFTGNECVPEIGTSLYRCKCSPGYLPSRDHPYSNCYKTETLCTKRVCLYGSCIESQDGSNTSCQCEHGFHGKSCEHLKGLWSQWTPWTPCSPHCSHRFGDVTKKRRRVCLGPSVDCFGPEAEFEVCHDAEKCLDPLPPEADALRHLRTWCTETFQPLIIGITIWVSAGLVGAKLLEVSLGKLLRIAFERWQMRINPPPTMELPSTD